MRTLTVLLSFALLFLGCGREPGDTPTPTGQVPPPTSAQPRQPAQPEVAADPSAPDSSAPESTPHGTGHGVEDQLAGLRKKLEDEDPEVRMKIVEELWQMGKRGSSAAPVLAEVLEDEDPRVRYRAVLALLASSC